MFCLPSVPSHTSSLFGTWRLALITVLWNAATSYCYMLSYCLYCTFIKVLFTFVWTWSKIVSGAPLFLSSWPFPLESWKNGTGFNLFHYPHEISYVERLSIPVSFCLHVVHLYPSYVPIFLVTFHKRSIPFQSMLYWISAVSKWAIRRDHFPLIQVQYFPHRGIIVRSCTLVCHGVYTYTCMSKLHALFQSLAYTRNRGVFLLVI